ncbi:MAG TPA: hypothetical protein VF484_10565 [Candidatus Limnocylindrales bacterium]
MDRKLIVGLFVAAALGLGACSSAGGAATPTANAGAGSGTGTGAGTGSGAGAGNAGGGTGANPCSLVSQQDVSTAIGQQVVAGTNTQDSHECDWFYPTADSITGGTLTIQDGDLASYCGKPSDPGLGLVIEQVSGVGDGACFSYVTTTTIGANLTFAKNGQVYSTAVYFGGGTSIDAVRSADKALALAVLSHL